MSRNSVRACSDPDVYDELDELRSAVKALTRRLEQVEGHPALEIPPLEINEEEPDG